MNLSRQDVLWSYTAQLLKIASGLLVLPLILRVLSVEEIALNYLLTTLGTLVALFDFGFAPQFARNITYVFSGAKGLKRQGVDVVDYTDEISYPLLAAMIETAKYTYRRIALTVVLFLVTFGTWYIYRITDGFQSIENALPIWCITIVSTFLGFYFTYFDSLLIGRGLIKEAQKATIIAKLTYILGTVLFLNLGWGLLGVVISNLISLFIYRSVSYNFFYDSTFRNNLQGIKVDREQKDELFGILWHNASKLGLVFVSAYAINNFSMFLAGLYLPSKEVASYGILIQLVGIISTISGTLFTSFNPVFSSLRISGDKNRLLKTFAFSMHVYYFFYILGALILIGLGPFVLNYIGANVILPAIPVMLLYCTVILLEGNHSNFATLIVSNNEVPFFKSSIIAGFFVLIGDYLVLNYTAYGIMGLIAVQGIVQLCYANWKWPTVICREFGINFIHFLGMGFTESWNKIKSIL